MRVIAIDWSGAATNAGEKIWLAEASEGRIIDLWNGRSREAVCDFLLEEERKGGDMAVGFDFGFSLPKWYMDECGFESAPALWAAMAHGRAEEWLTACAAPFFGRAGKTAPPLEQRFRQTELETANSVGGISPKSVFQIGGAGAVGTGSLRGMPVLHRLHEAGFSVWPFCEPRMPVVMEIYPRLLTGTVNKADAASRRVYMAQERYEHLGGLTRNLAASSEDAFDAAVSALVMWEHRAELASLPPAADETMLIEGAIWRPAGPCER